MTNIKDVSPTWSNTDVTNSLFVNGRMLSLASSQDGKTVFAGSLSNNVWVSNDGGQTWEQLVWPQPAPNEYDVPGSMGGYCVADLAVSPDSGRWLVDRAPRFLADLTGTGRADIVGFGETAVWTALSNGDGTFQPARVVLANFGYQAGDWRVDRHPRFLADVTGNGFADIVGFGDDGVWVALGNGDGTFQAANLVLGNFGYVAGDWRVEKHPRFLADLRGKGYVDIVGFGDAGVYLGLNDGTGNFTFQDPPIIADFGYEAGDWRVEKHPRFLADLRGKGFASIVGFGDDGVYVALNNGDGTFQPPALAVPNFGYVAGDWRVEKHPRFLADLQHTGYADIVGFGDDGVYISLNSGDGTFPTSPTAPAIANFGYDAGDWRVEKHPRLLADLRGKGYADIVGFGDDGVYVALNNGDGTFPTSPTTPAVADFGYIAGDWRVEKHPRFVANIRGAGPADIVGFGDAGVYVALSNIDGTIQPPQFVLANFGYELTVIAIVRSDREFQDCGIWRSSDRGNNWTMVHQFPRDVLTLNVNVPPQAGQLVWASGSGNMVYAAGGNALAISLDGGATFQNVLPLEGGEFQKINHVAVVPLRSGALLPPLVYALGDSLMFVSYDGGSNWTQDLGAIPSGVGGAVGLARSQAASVMAVSPRCPLEVFLITDGDPPNDLPTLWRGSYLPFLGSQRSTWDPVPMPALEDEFSGNVFIKATEPGRGEMLFYGPQRAKVYTIPLDPNLPTDWSELNGGDQLHVDLHGVFLGPDFAVTFQNGSYERTGTVWILSDGGIHWSTDGGNSFQAAQNVRTLSCVNVGGVAIQGKGPALSLNTGDNDGFYSFDGGQHWTSQDYGGGDNDCSYGDPLRPSSMLVFTPRWDTNGVPSHAVLGQTVAVYQASPGELPDATSTTNSRHVVPGPPLVASGGGDGFGNAWNASSGYALRGFRPLVLNWPGDDAATPGDYVFIRFIDGGPAVLLRTQNILAIHSRDDWATSATQLSQGAPVFQQGPALPSPHMGVVQASGGHTGTVFYVGGCLESFPGETVSNTELWKWTDGMKAWEKLVPGQSAQAARRFFVNPYDPSVLYLVDSEEVKRSDDGGTTWQQDVLLEKQLTCGGSIPVGRKIDANGPGDYLDVVLTDMQFDPANSLIRFAVGLGGAFYTNDGVNWSRLMDTRALPGRPANCYYDSVSNPEERALYVAFAGRSIVKISPLPTDRLLTVPDVFELSVPEARSIVRAAGLTPVFHGAQTAHSWVFSQSPSAGQVVAAESEVQMVLHTGRMP